jgi:hypothetical protein
VRDLVTRRRFLRTAGLVSGFSLLGRGRGGWMPGPRAAAADGAPTIEELTGGRLRVGETITRENVDAARELLSPGTYEKIARFGMTARLVPATDDPELLVPLAWLEASERNRGQAMLDANGQLWTTDGRPWTGGFPFLDPANGLEAAWNFASLSWLEYADDFLYRGAEHLIDRGHVERTLRWTFAGISTVGRAMVAPRPYVEGHENELHRLVIRYTDPFDYRGLSALTIRPYDQASLERAFVYIPATRRVREVPTSQRWESAAGNDIFRSDQNGSNDPLTYWDWRLVERRAMLVPDVADGYDVDPSPPVAGRFPRGAWVLRRDVQVLEARPRLAHCPYGKKILYVDPVMRKPVVFDFYDRAGRLWKTGAHYHARIRENGCTVISLSHPNHTMDLQADHVTYLWVEKDETRKNLGRKIEDLWTVEAMLRVAD